MNIQYKDPYSMSQKDWMKALKLLSGKRIFIDASDAAVGAETTASLIMKTAQQFGAWTTSVPGDEEDRDLFVSIGKGSSLPFRFLVGECPCGSEDVTDPKMSLVQESNHEELSARVLMAMCYFVQRKQHGTPLPELSRPVLGAVTKGSGGCFVCTVCMESADHPRVTELRDFRDQILMKNTVGRKAIGAYYAIGPKAADWLATRKMARDVVRTVVVLPAAAVARALTRRAIRPTSARG